MATPALRRFVAFVFLTSLLVITLHWAIGWSLKRVSTGELGSFNRAMQGRVNADIVVSGSSRAFRHYDPRILTRVTGLPAFNLGRNASQIDVQLGVLKAYLRQNKKPRLLIQNLDLQSFILTKPDDIYDPAAYVPYLDNPEIYSSFDQISPHIWKWKYLPLYAYGTADTLFTWTVGFKALWASGARDPCFDGFCPMNKPWTNEFERFKAKHPHGLDIVIDAGGVAALNELIEYCKKEGIQVVLVYSPQYYEMISLTLNRDRIFNLFTSIAGNHDVTFLDYTDSPISRNRAYFYNAQHLNEQGAAVFSEDLALKLRERSAVSRETTSPVSRVSPPNSKQ
jgi:hypothetical protein